MKFNVNSFKMSALIPNMVNINICNLHKQTFLGILNKLRSIKVSR